MKRLVLALCATALFALPTLPALAQAGCPWQFQPCSSCSCFSGCFDKCCDGERADLCASIICEAQCLTVVTTGSAAPAEPSFLAPAEACQGPASEVSPLDLDPAQPAADEAEPVVVASGE